MNSFPTDPSKLPAGPDKPQPFGYKTSWLAVRAERAEELVEALGPSGETILDVRETNWARGMTRICEPPPPRAVFVTPAFDGWVFGLGYSPPKHPATSADADVPAALQALESISSVLGRDVHFFGSDRVVDYVDWVKVEAARVVRAYAFADETLYDIGEPSAAEVELGIMSHEAWFEANDPELPMADEDTVLQLAARWTMSPMDLARFETPSMGLLVLLG